MPTKAELDARERELDERAAELTRGEEALVARMDAQTTKHETLDAQRAELLTVRETLAAEREALTARESALADRESAFERAREDLAVRMDTHAETGAFTLPVPMPGHGIAIMEFPSRLVGVLAAIHPSEAAVVAAQAAGQIEQALAESGKRELLRAAVPGELAIVTLSPTHSTHAGTVQ